MAKITQWFSRFFRRAPSHVRKPQRRRQWQPTVETLEDRLVPTVTGFSLFDQQGFPGPLAAVQIQGHDFPTIFKSTFDTQWQNVVNGQQLIYGQTIQQMVASLVQKQAQTKNVIAYKISESFAPKGSYAGNYDAWADPYTLKMQYFLPNNTLDFTTTTNSGWGTYADPKFHITYDLTIKVDLTFPSSLWAPRVDSSASAVINNVRVSSDNVGVWWEDLKGNDILGSMANQLSGTSYDLPGLANGSDLNLLLQLEAGKGYNHLVMRSDPTPDANGNHNLLLVAQLPNLVINGSANDTILVSGLPDGSLVAVAGHQLGQFDPGYLQMVTVNCGPGQNHVDIEGVPANVSVTVNCGPGQNQVTIKGVTGTASVTVNGGTGQNQVDIQSLSGSGSVAVNLGSGPSVIHGDLGSFSSLTVDSHGGTVTVDDQANPYVSTYTITATNVKRAIAGWPVRTFTINFTQFPGLKALVLDTGLLAADSVNVEATPAPTTVNGGYAADTFNVGLASHNLDGIAGPLTFNGGRGGATLAVNDQANSNNSKQPSTQYSIYATALKRQVSYGGAPPKGDPTTINYSHLGRLALRGGDNSPNTINVESNSVWTDVYAGSETGQINLTPTLQNLDGIGAFLDVWGHGLASLIVNDQANPHGRESGIATTYAIGDNFGRTATRKGGATVSMAMQFFQCQNFIVNTSTSSPNVVLVGSPGPTTINSGAADAITVYSDALQSGQTTVHAHGGSLYLDDRGEQNDDGNGNDILDQVFIVSYAISDQAVVRGEHEHTEMLIDESDLPGKGHGTKFEVMDSKFAGTVNYTNVASLRLDTGAVDTSFGISSTPAGTPLTINTQSGDRPATFRPRHAGGTTANQFQVAVKNLHSVLTLHGSGPNDTLLLDDSGATTQDIVSVTAAQVGAPATDRFFGSGGSLLYFALPRLTLNLSNARDDVVNLAPSASTAFLINGNRTQFQAGHGALLNLDLTGVTNPLNKPGAPGDGQWTFGNRQPVTYTAVAATHSKAGSTLAPSDGSFAYDAATKHYKQTVTLKNTSGTAVIGPLSLVLDGLSAGVKLVNQTGSTSKTSPAGSPYVNVALAGNELDVGQSVTVVLEFASPSSAITYTARVLAGSGPR
jgi:hypothetical protein